MSATPMQRARRFLGYHPVAQSGAIAASVISGLLYVILLLILALYLDLLIDRGQIPCFEQLSPREKAAFLQSQGDVKSPAAVWMRELPTLLGESVGSQANEAVYGEVQKHLQARGAEQGAITNLEDFGILGLVTRTRSTMQGSVIATIASWMPWTWRYGNVHYLQGLFFLALFIAALRLGALFLSDYLAGQTVVEAITRLRRAVYHHTYRLGNLAYQSEGPSEALAISNRHLEAVQEGLFAWLTIFFREPIKFVLLSIFALWVHFWLALAFALFGVLVWLIGGHVASYFRARGRKATMRSAEQLSFLQESLALMRLVKIYLMESFNQVRVERQLAGAARSQIRRYRGQAFYRPFFIFLGLASALVLMLFAGVVILNGQLGVTSALILVATLVSLYGPTIHWLEARRKVSKARTAAEAVFEFLDRPGSVGQAIDAEFLPGLTQMIEFDKITLKDPTGKKVLQGITLTVPAGSRVALVGPDDAEKLALVYLLVRLFDPTSGEIKIDQKKLRWITLDSLRNQIAMVLQHDLVFNDTVANNIGCGDPAFTLPKIIEAAKIAHAHQFIHKLPQGYETPIGARGHKLTIGEQFRVALARAILREPTVWVIEEPRTPLDDDTKSLLDDTLSRVLAGKTAIFLPHRMSTIRNCDRVYLLYQGKIEGQGDHRELLASNDLYRHLQYLEFNEFAGRKTTE